MIPTPGQRFRPYLFLTIFFLGAAFFMWAMPTQDMAVVHLVIWADLAAALLVLIAGFAAAAKPSVFDEEDYAKYGRGVAAIEADSHGQKKALEDTRAGKKAERRGRLGALRK